MGFVQRYVPKYFSKETRSQKTQTDCLISFHLIRLIVSKQVCYRQVLNVTSFLSEHPGGELAILTFAGYWPATTMGLSFLNCMVEVLRLSTYS